MKILHLFLMFLMFTNTACSKKQEETPPQKEENKKKENPTETTNGIKNFFVAYLNNNSVNYNESKPLQLSEIAESQQKVWNYWKEANQEELKTLGVLLPIASAPALFWKLPEHLEPDAKMLFYWGSKGTQPEKGYPLFVYMHGSGHKEQEWATGKALALNFKDEPSVYFVPQIPNTGQYYRWWQKAKQYAWEKLLRLAFVSEKIDANKVYFFGISEGGYGSQRLASFYADYLAGAGPMAGGEPLINAPVENCRNIAFSFLTGEKDYMFHRNILTQYTKEAFEQFQAADPTGFVHNIELIPNQGHHINYDQTTPWLRQYTRNRHPKKVIWEDYQVDGVYRKGFYNLYVKERFSDRTRYTMEVIDNKVIINIDAVSYQGVETSSNWGFVTKYEKTYTPMQKANFVLYLNDTLVDFSKNVVVEVNGNTVFNGKVMPDLQHIVRSCATFFDPERLFPVAIDVKL